MPKVNATQQEQIQGCTPNEGANNIKNVSSLKGPTLSQQEEPAVSPTEGPLVSLLGGLAILELPSDYDS